MIIPYFTYILWGKFKPLINVKYVDKSKNLFSFN